MKGGHTSCGKLGGLESRKTLLKHVAKTSLKHVDIIHYDTTNYIITFPPRRL
jgi:hypothetical protein